MRNGNVGRMDSKEILTLIGWPVAFLLGVGTKWVGEKVTAKKRVIEWEIVNESELSVS